MNTHYLNDEYFNVSYSVHTPGYYDQESGCAGFNNEVDGMAFYADCERVFQAAGWIIENGYAVNGKSKLHLHPQQFLGFVRAELLNTVPDIIAQGTLFHNGHCGTRIIGKLYDITAEQQREFIAAKRPEIETELIEAFRTKRRNLFHTGDSIWRNIELPLGKKYGLPAIDEKINHVASGYVNEIFSSLVRSGRIIKVMYKGNPVYRTIMKSELPTKRKKGNALPSDTPELF